MSDIVIKTENLSKSYIIRHKTNERYVALRDVLANGVKRLGRKLAGLSAGRLDSTREEFYALRDVSFEIKQGERVGIIGKNGAGKSTLLKILSRITEPTTGRIEITGRVASLLEVGTGFHPELTGRENIFLNGAILGMKRTEIKKRFDEIVAFAEIEKFLDTPVKRYSSGMYVRLAFAIAAHLEPEILIVDEVLAVGDAQFQKKCLGKMDQVSREGRTVIFVSHNMGVIDSLCNSSIYLKNGLIVLFSKSQTVIERYLSDSSNISLCPIRSRTDRTGDGHIRITDVQIKPILSDVLRTGEQADILVFYEVPDGGNYNNVTVAIGIDDNNGNRLMTLWSRFNLQYFNNVNATGCFVCKVPKILLKSGVYNMHVYIDSISNVCDCVLNAVKFSVEYGKFYCSGIEPSSDQGYFMQDHDWSIQKLTNR